MKDHNGEDYELDEETLREHIQQRHPGVTREKIEAVFGDPNRVRKSKTNKEVNMVIGQNPDSEKHGLFIVVVNAIWKKILTAFPARNENTGGEVIYEKKREED